MLHINIVNIGLFFSQLTREKERKIQKFESRKKIQIKFQK